MFIVQRTAIKLSTWNTIEFTPTRNGSDPRRNSSNPVIIQHEQMELGFTGVQTPSEATTDTGKNMPKESTSDATADNDLNMQTDDEFLQVDVQQEKIDTLYADAMEDLIT